MPVRCFTKNGHDWAYRFPAIVDAARRIHTNFLIDGEAVILNDDGASDFQALRGRGRGSEVVLVAFDLLELYGHDLRDLPLIERKRRLWKLLGRTKKWRAIQYGQHLIGDGPAIFAHVCKTGLEGVVSKRTDAPYRSGPSKVWVKSKNRPARLVQREREEEEWR